jgi:hypothetical protein
MLVSQGMTSLSDKHTLDDHASSLSENTSSLVAATEIARHSNQHARMICVCQSITGARSRGAQQRSDARYSVNRAHGDGADGADLGAGAARWLKPAEPPARPPERAASAMSGVEALCMAQSTGKHRDPGEDVMT